MRCVVSTCNHDSNNISSQGITFHTFPSEPANCEAWLKALDKEGWSPEDDSAVCSSHFLINDLYVTAGGLCKVRDGAIPIVLKQDELKNSKVITQCDIKICRICFATDCNLYSMNSFKNLCLAYGTISGYVVENENNMPSSLCSECAHQLMNCFSFRKKILQSHMTLQAILRTNDCLTIESIKSFDSNQNEDNSSLGKQSKNYQYDVEIQRVKNDPDEQICPDIPPAFEHFILDGIKKENDDVLDQSNDKDDDISHDIVYSPILHKYIFRDSVKMEKDDDFNTNSLNFQDTVNFDTEHSNTQFLDDDFSMDDSQAAQDGEETDDDFSMDESQAAQDEEETAKNSAAINKKQRKTTNNLMQPNNDFKKICPETSGSLKLNDKASTSETSERPFTCSICNKSFNQKSCLMNHLRIHSGEKPYSCDICKKTFNDKSNYRKHLRIHSGEKPFPCTYCDKTFNRKNYLENHLRTHSGEKPYSCGICSKVFGHKHHLKSHLRIHSGEKPYSCEICHKEFSEKSNLHIHLKVHSGDKLHSCGVCKVAFSTKYLLKCHSKVHSGSSVDRLKSLTKDSGLQITIQNVTSK